MWEKLINAVPDTLKSLFGIIDQVVPDKDEANQLKFALAQLVAGSKIFEIVMLLNFGLLGALTVMQRKPPAWCLWVFLIWAIGPLVNTLSKEAIEKIGMIIRTTQGTEGTKKIKGTQGTKGT